MIKILILAANPTDSTHLRLDQEVRSIDEALVESKFRYQFDVKQHWAVRSSDLQSILMRHEPNIVHFCGHGSIFNEIVLEDDKGECNPISTDALGQLFLLLKGNIRCVVLNACYSVKQAREIANHIDCVIGMSAAIGDESAIKFSKAFYRGLGFGKDVKTAFDLGRLEIDLAGLSEKDIPRLLSKTAPETIKFFDEQQIIRHQKEESVWRKCAYCDGSGDDPALSYLFNVPCPTCKGKMKNLVPPSANPCDFCDGKGRDPAFRMKATWKPCPECRGVGFINRS